MEHAVKAAFPGADVSGKVVAKAQSFEVMVDGKLIYSKLTSGKFPDPQTIVELLKEKK